MKTPEIIIPKTIKANLKNFIGIKSAKYYLNKKGLPILMVNSKNILSVSFTLDELKQLIEFMESQEK